MAEIGHEPEVPHAGPDQETDRIIGIMGNAETVRAHVPDLKRGAGGEHSKIAFDPQGQLDGLLGQAIAIDRDLQFGGQSNQALNMIRVLMRDENAVQILRSSPQGEEPLANLTPAQPRIHKEPGLIGLQVSAVTAGSAPEYGEFHGHHPTLRRGPTRGNDFPCELPTFVDGAPRLAFPEWERAPALKTLEKTFQNRDGCSVYLWNRDRSGVHPVVAGNGVVDAIPGWCAPG